MNAACCLDYSGDLGDIDIWSRASRNALRSQQLRMRPQQSHMRSFDNKRYWTNIRSLGDRSSKSCTQLCSSNSSTELLTPLFHWMGFESDSLLANSSQWRRLTSRRLHDSPLQVFPTCTHSSMPLWRSEKSSRTTIRYERPTQLPA